MSYLNALGPSQYTLSEMIARRDQQAYETWRDSEDDDGHEMSRIFQSIGVRPIKVEATDEF